MKIELELLRQNKTSAVNRKNNLDPDIYRPWSPTKADFGFGY